jgi:hypothetical protein
MSTDDARRPRDKSSFELPFRLSQTLSAEQKLAIEGIALSANDRYVEEFLEAHGFCPYAKAGRERGVTARHVHFAETSLVGPLAAIFQSAAAGTLEVVQVIFPLVEVAAADFARFANDVTEYLNARFERPVFASAALHPELAFRTDSPNALIPLFRRTPDPTLQWVRLATLDGIYEGRRGGTAFVDVSKMREFMSVPAGRDLYQDIAQTNRASAERLGVERICSLLGQVRDDARKAYRAVLQG